MPRSRSVYVTDTPDLFPLWRVGSHLHHVHEVEPAGAVERGHAGWWTLVNLHQDEAGFEDQVICWAEAYWAGEECSDGHPLVGTLRHRPASFPGEWEYRCPAFKIVADHGPAWQRIGDATVRFDGDRCLMLSIPGSPDVEDLLGKPIARGDVWHYNMPFHAARAAWLECRLLGLVNLKQDKVEQLQDNPEAGIEPGGMR